MKKNASPELSAQWWKRNQPEGLANARDFGEALGDYETALADLARSGSQDDCTACTKALDRILAAAKKLQDDAQKTLKSPPRGLKLDADDYANTIDALKRYAGVVEEARKDVAKLNAGDAAEPEGLLADESQYAEYLRAALRRARTAPLNFAFAPGGKAPEHRMLLDRSKRGQALGARLASEAGLKKFCHGIAQADANEADLLVLAIEGKLVGGLRRKCLEMFKALQVTTFRRINVLVDGEEIADLPDDGDTAPAASAPADTSDALEAQWLALKASLSPKINAAIAAHPANRDAILRLFGMATRSERDKAYADALANFRELETLLAAAPVEAATSASGAVVDWPTARATAVEQLRKLGAAIAKAKDPDTGEAVVQLQAIIKNLAPEPANKRAVDEIERYLTNDEIIGDVESPNPFGVRIALREPLMAALHALKAQLPA